jgi:hypothetical protein
MKKMKATVAFNGLTKGLDNKTYAIGKVHAWMKLLNENIRPTKFFNPTKNGTRVNVEQIMDQAEYDKGLEELEAYAYAVNKKHGTNFRFKPESEVQSNE